MNATIVSSISDSDWENEYVPMLGCLLDEVFNLKDFKSVQLEEIRASLEKKHSTGVVSTGGDKSLCNQSLSYKAVLVYGNKRVI